MSGAEAAALPGDSEPTAVPGASGDPAHGPPPGDPESVARIVCLRMLDRRAYSRSELAAALTKRGVPDDAATAVLDRFTEVGLVDDALLAHQLAHAQHTERGLAARAIVVKLRQRGLPDQAVRDAVDTIDRESERAAAERLVARKLRSMRGLDPQVRARRLVGLLGRKGYPAGLAYDVVRSALAQIGDDEFGSNVEPLD